MFNESMSMTNEEFVAAKLIRSNLFGDRDTVQDAMKYVFDVIHSLPKSDQAGVITAVMVLMNTISKELLKTEN